MNTGLGDFDLSTVLHHKFATYRPSTGASFTLAGTPAISVYKDGSTTQSTSGVTLTVDFDGVTGLNHLAIDTSSDGTFYSAGSFFQAVITTGTIDGVSITGSVVASFTLRKTSALRPTTAGQSLDVSATGEAGIDWANVGSPTTALALTNTTVATVTNLTNAPTAGDLTAAMKASVTTAATAATPVAASVTGNVGGNVVGSVASVTTPVVVGSTSVGALDAGSFTSGAEQAFADKLLDRDMSTGTDSGTEIIRTPRQAFRVLRNKVDIPNGKVKKEDDTSDSWTFATTTAAGNPVTVVDPT